MTLVDDSIAILLQHPTTQHAGPRPPRLVRIHLHPAAAAAAALLVVAVAHAHVGEAVAAVIAAVLVAGAGAAAAEASLGGRDAVAQHGVVDETEGGREALVVLLVDGCYRVAGVVGEGADLAPLAGLLFGGDILVGGVSVGLVAAVGEGQRTGFEVPWWKKWRRLLTSSMTDLH